MADKDKGAATHTGSCETVHQLSRRTPQGESLALLAPWPFQETPFSGHLLGRRRKPKREKLSAYKRERKTERGRGGGREWGRHRREGGR